MRIGIPREIKDGEYRVALTPSAVRQLANVGHECRIGDHVFIGPGAMVLGRVTIESIENKRR